MAAAKIMHHNFRNCRFLLLVTLLPFLSKAMELDKYGGYGIVVGIDPAEFGFRISDEEQREYINNLKTMVQDFSQLLWESTNSVFHIKTVDILVPDSWVAALNANVSVKATYHGADIQISDSFKVPLVENFYPCGKPGVRIQLPTEFVDKTSTEEIYGSQAKGLLNLWLRYRFGVWEEHGYPGHPITPYMYNLNNVYESHWRLTSCNNSQLNGDFAPKVKAGPNDTCIPNGATPIGDDCRFYPFQDTGRNNATSSLMNFHWVESLHKLCDKSSHEKLAPNRQNLHCNFRSVWEIIESSPDFNFLGDMGKKNLKSKQTQPEVVFNVIGTSRFPILYILLDVQFDHNRDGGLYKFWLSGLAEFVDNLPTNVIIKMVRFPTKGGPVPTPELKVAVDWSLFDYNSAVREQLLKSFQIFDDGVFPVPEPVDFRLGMSQAMAELKLRNHPRGAVFLALRTSDLPFVYANTLGHGAYEQEYILELKQYDVTMYAIEVVYSTDFVRRFPCLARMVEESNGVSGVVYHRDPAIALGTMRPVLQFVNERLEGGLPSELPPPIAGSAGMSSASISQRMKHEIIYYKLLYLEAKEETILIPKREDFAFLHMFITAVGGRLHHIDFQHGTSDPAIVNEARYDFDEHSEYFEYVSVFPEEEANRGHTYVKVLSKAELNSSGSNESWPWRINLEAAPVKAPQKVRAMIFVYVSVPEEPTLGPNQLTAAIFTSAPNDRFACTIGQMNQEPLSICAKFSGTDDKPILLEAPIARLVEATSDTIFEMELKDGGFGADLFEGDGVYCGSLYPNVSGIYEIYVKLYELDTNTSREVTGVRIPTRVLPRARQTDLTDNVTNGTTLNTPYSVVFKWSRVLHVANTSCADIKHISHISDLRVESLDELNFTIAFTVPVLTTTERQPREDYAVVADYEGTASLSNNLSLLISNFAGGSLRHFSIMGKSSGDTVRVMLVEVPDRYFVAIRLAHTDGLVLNSPVSNVVRGWRTVTDATENDPLDSPLDCGLLSCQLAIGVGSGLALLVMLVVSLFLWRKNRAQKESLRNLTRQEIKEFLHGSPNSRVTENQAIEELDYDQIQSLPYDSKYEIPINKLHIDRTDLIGSGMFGNVYKGYVVNFGGSRDKVLIVAVKTMKPGLDKAYFKAMLAEVKLMTLIGGAHPNIVKLVGASTKNIRKFEVFLATEFCANGSLSSYLLKLEPEAVTVWNLLKWSREIASGMEYLGQKRVVHGDLAARNILLDAQLIAMVSDFGLSKQLVNYSYGYTNIDAEDTEISHKEDVQVEGVGGGGGLLPWKWLAPESLKQLKFSVASDVWAYGITIWEVFGLAREVPYPGIKWSADFVHRLEKDGLRLTRPDFATDGVYELMLSCWELDPPQRPRFCTLKNGLDEMMMGIRPTEYMQVEAEEPLITPD